MADVAVLPNDQLVNVNGLDIAMLNESQVREMLEQRPLRLRFTRSRKVRHKEDDV